MKSLKDYIKSKSEFTVGGTKSNKLLIFDGMNSSFKTMEYSKNMLCEECGENRF